MKMPMNLIYMKPNSPRQLHDKILLSGGFLDGLQYLEYHLSSTCLETTTIIIQGSVGCGKKTLIKKTEELYLKKKGTITIYLNPYFLTDDISALKFINSRLGLPPKQTLQDVCKSIRDCNSKMVIVLLNFEVFCRKKQSLLYCLTDFTRSGSRINLIGLTTSLDCTELVEKRVKSRLNPIFYDLSTPYRNLDEYLEFASILLGNHKIEGLMREQLEFLYMTTNRAIISLKRYLVNLCLWTDQELTVHQPSSTETASSRGGNSNLKIQLSCLTRTQLELLTIAVCCFESQPEKLEMTMMDLQDFTRKRNYDKFDSSSALTCKNSKLLSTLGLFKPVKWDISFTRQTKFTLGVMPVELKNELSGNKQFRSSDMIWRLLR